MAVDVPIFRIHLSRLEAELLAMVDARHGELRDAIQKGIDLAYHQIPVLVSQRVQAAIEEAVWNATGKALEAYYSPGGEGWDKVMSMVTDSVRSAGTGASKPGE